MREKLGPLSLGRDGFRGGEARFVFPGERPEISDATAQVVDEEVARMIKEAHDRAAEILGERRDLLERLSKLLMVREVIEGKALTDYVEGNLPIPTAEEAERDQAATEPIPGPQIVASQPE